MVNTHSYQQRITVKCGRQSHGGKEQPHLGAFLGLSQRSGVFRAVPYSLLLPLSDWSLPFPQVSWERTLGERADCKAIVSYQTHQSVQFSHSVMSSSLWPHGLQHSRPPCPSPTHGAYSNSCPSSWWCYPTISSSVVLFSCLQSFPASGSFLRSQFFRWPKYWRFSFTSVLPMNIQDWFPLELIDLVSLQSNRLSRVFSNTPVQKHQTHHNNAYLCQEI